jgi:hypothetical protein
MSTGADRANLRRYARFVLPALLALFQLGASIGAGRGQPDRRPVDLFAAVLLLAAGLSLIWMRRYPVQVLAFTAGVFLLYLLREYPYGPMAFSPLIAAFNAILIGPRPGSPPHCCTPGTSAAGSCSTWTGRNRSRCSRSASGS